MLMNSASERRSTTAERLAAHLSQQILEGRLAPGAPLREEELARSNTVSRHVVREALRIVVSEGLATYEAYKGARVSYISTEDVQDIYRVRKFFELPALGKLEAESHRKLAHIHGQFEAAVEASRWPEAYELDLKFHAEIVAGTKSKRIITWHAELFQTLSRAHLVRSDFQARGFRESVAQHAQIVVALAAGNPKAAEAALSRHLSYSESLLTRATAA
ncbi:MAG: GntR family transcriptional regulator [Pseudomonadota bacterium]|nr:GntR family transcriptional regulator [Pseudomonadota bacterium]